MPYKDKDEKATYTKQWGKANMARRKAANDRWKQRHPEENLLMHRVSNAKSIIEAQGILGSRCEMCGESDPMVLEFNHRNGDGSKHRKELRLHAGLDTCLWVRRNPVEARERLQLLCANCHARVHSGFNSIEGYSASLESVRYHHGAKRRT